jgi:amino acid transporter
MSVLFLKKDLSRLIKDADGDMGEGGAHGAGLRRSLGPFDLTMLGIGAIIGAGIFTLTGEAAASYAGPAIVYSFILGGILCALAGLCYAEMAAMIPVAGSAYAYSYATMGEFIAWIIGWDLVLEYAFGAVTVANGWSGYLYSLLHRTLGLTLPDLALRLTNGPWETVTLAGGQRAAGLWNLPASLVVCLGVPILRRTSPGVTRPFKVPLPWVVGGAGALSCLWVMSGLDLDTWIRLVLWLIAGLGIYFIYGRRHSRLQRERGARFGPVRLDLLGSALTLLGLAGLAWSTHALWPLAQHAGWAPTFGASLPGEDAAAGQVLAALGCAVLVGCGIRTIVTNKR